MELGSEFNLSLAKLNKADYNLFTYLNGFSNVVYLDSGRSAIRYLTSQLSEQDEVLLPEFICESVINCFKKDKISFYKVSANFVADVDDLRRKITTKTKIVFLMHYFGVLQPKGVLSEISDLAKKYGCVIIEDATHSLFTDKNTIGDYVISSIRKWMPIPKGGILFVVRDKLHIQSLDLKKSTDNEKAYGMVLKDLFLKGILDCNSEYRDIFVTCEEKLDEQSDIYQISDFSEYVASCIDITEIIEKRKKNYQYLSTKLERLGVVSAIRMTEDACPLVFLLRLPERDSFRRYLMKNSIYCAVHWPSDGIMETDRLQAIRNSRELLSLPIDQRYDKEHMDYLVEVISKYGGDLSF